MPRDNLFLSYSPLDQPWAAEFAAQLKERGFSILPQRQTLELSEEWADATRSAIQAADYFIGIVHPKSAANEGLYFETGVAAGLGKWIVFIVETKSHAAPLPIRLSPAKIMLRSSPSSTAKEFSLWLAALPSRRRHTPYWASSFVLRRASSGEYYFILVAENGDAVLTSGMYQTKDAARNGMQAVRLNAPVASRYQKKTATDGGRYFVLFAPNKELLATSEIYSSPQAMETAAVTVKRIAPHAPAVDLS